MILDITREVEIDLCIYRVTDQGHKALMWYSNPTVYSSQTGVHIFRT